MSFRRSYCAALARGADALKRLAAAHRGGAKEDWAVVSAKAVAAVCAAVPPGTDNVANFGSEEQAVLSAALDALHALATDELEAQTLPWCQEVTCVTTAWGFLREACTLTERVKQQSAPWMVQQSEDRGWVLAVRPACPCRDLARAAAPRSAAPHPACPCLAVPGILDLLVQLLIHVKGVAAHTDDLRLPRSAMTMTTNLMTMVKDIAVVNRAAGRGAAELVPVLALATEVLNLLMNGPGSFDGPAGCSCCLAAPAGASGSGAGAAAAQQPRALGNRGARPMRTEQLASGAAISDILDTINLVQGEVECGQAPGPRPLATHRATLLINLQTLAINLAEARRLTGQGRRRPGRRSAASPAVPSCADITAFLGATQDPAFFEPKLGAYWAAQPEVALLADALRISRQLEAALAPGGAPACPACTASQLLLLVEAATLCPREALRSADLRRRVLANVATLLTDSACDWTPAFQRAAVPSLAAWVAAAAQELPAGPAAAAATCHGTATYSSAAAAVLNTIHMIVDLPGSCLQAPHPALPLPQLLAATERGLRCCVADEHLHACDAGLVVIKVGQLARTGGGWAGRPLAGAARRGAHQGVPQAAGALQSQQHPPPPRRATLLAAPPPAGPDHPRTRQPGPAVDQWGAARPGHHRLQAGADQPRRQRAGGDLHDGAAGGLAAGAGRLAAGALVGCQRRAAAVCPVPAGPRGWQAGGGAVGHPGRPPAPAQRAAGGLHGDVCLQRRACSDPDAGRAAAAGGADAGGRTRPAAGAHGRVQPPRQCAGARRRPGAGRGAGQRGQQGPAHPGGPAPPAGLAGPGPAPAGLLQPCLPLPGRRQ